jgi:ubiquinone/menaquinone biosynthesis C-methylase UbiE
VQTGEHAVADFDTFADQYDETFTLTPFRTHIEAYSLLRQLGEVRGQAWLDVACGTGRTAVSSATVLRSWRSSSRSSALTSCTAGRWPASACLAGSAR